MNYVRGMNTVKNMMDFFPRNRERTDMVLEPLQAMVQLGLLGFAPAGTKLAIQHNVLILQRPSFTQGVLRWYSGDKKDDLYYLFHVFRRFILWYGNENSLRITSHGHIHHQLYKTLIHYAYLGINQLMTTYQRCEMGSLVHVLQMYKMFLKKPEYFLNQQLVIRQKPRSLSHEESREHESDTDVDTVVSRGGRNTVQSEPSPKQSPISPSLSPLQPSEVLNVDLIFQQTKEMYSKDMKRVIVHTFEILAQCKEEEREALIDGLTLIMSPVTRQLQRWIQERLVF